MNIKTIGNTWFIEADNFINNSNIPIGSLLFNKNNKMLFIKIRNNLNNYDWVSIKNNIYGLIGFDGNFSVSFPNRNAWVTLANRIIWNEYYCKGIYENNGKLFFLHPGIYKVYIKAFCSISSGNATYRFGFILNENYGGIYAQNRFYLHFNNNRYHISTRESFLTINNKFDNIEVIVMNETSTIQLNVLNIFLFVQKIN